MLRQLDWAAFSERARKGEFEAGFTGQVFFPPNVDPYPYYHSSQWPPERPEHGLLQERRGGPGSWRPRATSSIDGKRLELYRQVARIFAADPPADFLYGADQYWAISKRVEDVEISPFYGLFHFLPGPLGWRPAAVAKR